MGQFASHDADGLRHDDEPSYNFAFVARGNAFVFYDAAEPSYNFAFVYCDDVFGDSRDVEPGYNFVFVILSRCRSFLRRCR